MSVAVKRGIYTFVTNKNGRGKKGTMVASIKGTSRFLIFSNLTSTCITGFLHHSQSSLRYQGRARGNFARGRTPPTTVFASYFPSFVSGSPSIVRSLRAGISRISGCIDVWILKTPRSLLLTSKKKKKKKRNKKKKKKMSNHVI